MFQTVGFLLVDIVYNGVNRIKNETESSYLILYICDVFRQKIKGRGDENDAETIKKMEI